MTLIKVDGSKSNHPVATHALASQIRASAYNVIQQSEPRSHVFVFWIRDVEHKFPLLAAPITGGAAVTMTCMRRYFLKVDETQRGIPLRDDVNLTG
jgi:hypothetical protein